MNATDDEHDGPTIAVGGVLLPITESVVARFDAKVDRSGGPDRCWIWVAGQNGTGYGRIKLSGLWVLAHRLSYVLAYGGIDPGLVIDHRCHTHGCVNPAHLRLVTSAVNSANRSGAQANSRSGVRGVSWWAWGGRWRASAARDGRRYHGGCHDALEDAERAAIRLRIRIGVASLADPERLNELMKPGVE